MLRLLGYRTHILARQRSLFIHFSLSTQHASTGLDLFAKGQPVIAFDELRLAVEQAGNDVFPRSEEVFFALGVLTSDDCAVLKDDRVDDTTGGAKNRQEVFAQIKAKRKEAMRQKRARHSSKGKGVAELTQSSTRDSTSVPPLPTEVVSGGVTITLTRAPQPPANQPQPTYVEECVGEPDSVAASFFQLAAESGHAGAMVALGNLALGAAEEALGNERDDDASAQALDGRGAIFPSAKRTAEAAAATTWTLPEVSTLLALHWYERAASLHHPDALFNLGQTYFEGRGSVGVTAVAVPGGGENEGEAEGAALRERVTRGVAYFERAAKVGDPSASFFLAMLAIEDGDGASYCEAPRPRSDDHDDDHDDLVVKVGKPGSSSSGRARGRAALKHLHAAVRAGHGGAAYYLALLHLNGWASELGPPFDYPSSGSADHSSDESKDGGKGAAGCDAATGAALPLNEQEEKGAADASRIIGRDRLAGFQKWLRVAAHELSDPDALFCLADSAFHGSDGFEQDHVEALECWGRAAASSAGHADAMCCLGAVSYHGLCGQPRDLAKAFEWYQRAADATQLQGGPPLHRLGLVEFKQQAQGQHVRGSGGDARVDGAPSTTVGAGAASANTGKLSASGVGASLSSSASSAGAHREAWSNLASMYALGHGVPKCMNTAKHILRFLDSLDAHNEENDESITR